MRALVVVGLLAGAAHADDEPCACEYARHATVAFVATELSPLPDVGGHVDFEGGARIHRGHLAIEARLGAAWSFSASSGGDVFGARIGASVGWVLPLAHRFAVVPMAGYDAFVLWESAGVTTQLVHRATVEVPLSILLYPHAIVEPYVAVGLQSLHGSRDLAFVFGPRVAIAF
jgi:hypothetical protein